MFDFPRKDLLLVTLVAAVFLSLSFAIGTISPEGNLAKVFGEVRGNGAGAFANPTGLSVGAGGEVWVCDPVQRKITRFNPEGRARTFAPQSAVDRIAAVGDVLITMAPRAEMRSSRCTTCQATV